MFVMRLFIHQREKNFKSLRDDVEALWDIVRLMLWEVLEGRLGRDYSSRN